MPDIRLPTVALLSGQHMLTRLYWGDGFDRSISNNNVMGWSPGLTESSFQLLIAEELWSYRSLGTGNAFYVSVALFRDAIKLQY